MKLARRFNAGARIRRERSPRGTNDGWHYGTATEWNSGTKMAALLPCSSYMWYHFTNMGAELVFHEKRFLSDGSFQEIKIWSVLASRDKPHGYKYSFAYIVNGERVVGYDNAEGKGDHRHFVGKEYPYKFKGLAKLWNDFRNDIRRFREEES